MSIINIETSLQNIQTGSFEQRSLTSSNQDYYEKEVAIKRIEALYEFEENIIEGSFKNQMNLYEINKEYFEAPAVMNALIASETLKNLGIAYQNTDKKHLNYSGLYSQMNYRNYYIVDAGFIYGTN